MHPAKAHVGALTPREAGPPAIPCADMAHGYDETADGSLLLIRPPRPKGEGCGPGAYSPTDALCMQRAPRIDFGRTTGRDHGVSESHWTRHWKERRDEEEDPSQSPLAQVAVTRKPMPLAIAVLCSSITSRAPRSHQRASPRSEQWSSPVSSPRSHLLQHPLQTPRDAPSSSIEHEKSPCGGAGVQRDSGPGVRSGPGTFHLGTFCDTFHLGTFCDTFHVEQRGVGCTLPVPRFPQQARYHARPAVPPPLLGLTPRTTEVEAVLSVRRSDPLPAWRPPPLLASTAFDFWGVGDDPEEREEKHGKEASARPSRKQALLDGWDGPSPPPGLCKRELLLWRAFHSADTDGSGTISRQELCEALKLAGGMAGLGSQRMVHTLRAADANSDHQISWDEWLTLARSEPDLHLADLRQCSI